MVAPKWDVPANRTWTQEGVGGGNVTPVPVARNGSVTFETEIASESGVTPSGSPLGSSAATLDRAHPLVLSAPARFAAVPLVAGPSLEQFAAPPVRTHREAIDVDGFVGRIVLVVGSS